MLHWFRGFLKEQGRKDGWLLCVQSHNLTPCSTLQAHDNTEVLEKCTDQYFNKCMSHPSQAISYTTLCLIFHSVWWQLSLYNSQLDIIEPHSEATLKQALLCNTCRFSAIGKEEADLATLALIKMSLYSNHWFTGHEAHHTVNSFYMTLGHLL